MNVEQLEQKEEAVTKVGNSNTKQGDWLAQVERITRIAERLIWLLVLVIITAAVANFLKIQSPNFDKTQPIVENIPIERPIPVQVNQEIASALREARIETKNFASARLDLWKDDVMKRVDDNFLPWYFNYFNQQFLGLKFIVQGAYHWFNSSASTPETSLIKEIQREFESRVLLPELAQATFNEVIEDSVNFYTQELSRKIDTIPSRYKIPQGQWERYLEKFALITNKAEGNREVSLPEKGIFATTGTGSLYLVGESLAKLAKFGGMQALESKAGAKLASNVASKTASKLAAKSGVKLVGKSVVRPALGIGLVAWAVWDHYHTKATQLPILRQNIEEYLDQVQASLLKDPTVGLLSVIYDLEKQVLKASQG